MRVQFSIRLLRCLGLLPFLAVPAAGTQQPVTRPAPATTAPSSSPESGAPASSIHQTQGQSQNNTQKSTPPTIRATTQLVEMVASVTDHRHHFITDLEESDFRVQEDGKDQKIVFFSRQTDLPLRIGMLLDTSNSIRDRLKFEQDAAIDFLNDVIRRNKDLAFLMTFDNAPEVIKDYTNDLSDLAQAIEKQRAGGGTALNDAIYAAAEKLASAPLPAGPNPDVRRVLVVFSDGDDNLSDHAQSDAMQMAERAGVVVYSISTDTDWLAIDDAEHPHKLSKSAGEGVLQQFAEQTGGRIFFPYKVDDLAISFQDISTELRSQYLLGYSPAEIVPGKYRKIKVETSRKGLEVRTRKGYYATAASAATASGGAQ
jgi:Ca-activated chloride channel family protein